MNKHVNEACSALRDGALVIVPTDTVYGLAADAHNTKAVQRLYALKQRPADQPFSLLVADSAMAERYGVFDDRARALAARFWPGALTLIVPKRADALLCPAVTGAVGTIGLRVPAHEKTQSLIAHFNGALAAPSANIAGAPAPTRAEDIASEIMAGAALYLEDGPCQKGVSSTLVNLSHGEVHVLREGNITQREIMDALPPFQGKTETP